MPPDQLVLAFDTSAAHCAAALICGDQILSEHVEAMSKGQAEKLFPVLEGLLENAGKTWKDLERIAVGIGPGNFTGIRISVASARGLSLSLQIPAIGVSTFEALSFGLPRPVMAVVDARADQIYVQKYSGETTQDPFVTDVDFSTGPTVGKHSIVGLPGHTLAKRLGLEFVEPKFSFPVAIGLVALTKDPGDFERPAPLYLKSADANPPKDPAPNILS